MKQCKLIAAVLLMALCLSACAAADETVRYTSGDFVYILLDDGTAEIVDYTGKATALTVPKELDGYRVTSVGRQTFWDCDFIEGITIPDTIEHVGVLAFSGNSNLTCFRVNASHPTLAVIDGVLFNKTEKKLIYYPGGLKAPSYTVPYGIRVIGEWAFSDCDILTSVIIPDSVISIEDYAFSNSRSLTSIIIPEGVISLGRNVFDSCESLTSITLPASLSSITKKSRLNMNPMLVYTVPQGSYAEQWCRDNNCYYTYPNANDWLLN